MNKGIRYLLVLTMTLLAVSFSVSAQASNYMANTNAQAIYVYLRDSMGLNNAGCAAVLANIRAESNFNPNDTYMEADGYRSYGICQWHLERDQALQNYCRNHGYDYTTLSGQLHYFEYEIQTSYYSHIYNNLRNTPNTEQGAYDAASYFCIHFEVPANKYVVGAQRGEVARQIFAELDTSAPSISNIQVSNVSSSGYTVTCTVSDNVGVTEVKFPTWTEQNGQDDLIWHVGTISGNTASFNVRTSDHNNETGCTYITHIYAYDAAGNSSNDGTSAFVPAPDTTKPTISNVEVTNLTSEGYTVTCTVSDNVGVTKVQFPTWYEGQQGEDATWHDGTISGNTASCHIRVSDHDGKTGLNYHTDIYAWDAAGNVASANARYNFVPNPTVRVTSITLDKSNLTMDIGTTYKLAATVLPSNATDKSLFWATNNSAACTVDDGVVTAVGAGTAIITCAANDGSGVSVTCNVTVNEPVPDFSLPAGLIEIDEEAFAGINAQKITLPGGVQRIGKRAFAGCTKLKYIYIPAATTQIASDAFSGVSSSFVIHGKYNSYARTYASQNGYTFVADDVCTITFNANGGSCSTTSKTVNIGSAIGTLPSASRSYYTFNGWYTAASGGSKVSVSSTFTSSTTLYAHWTEHEWSDWVTEDQLPSGTIQKESKQQYRYQDKVYSGWSDWGEWTTNRESTDELKREEQTTLHYWYYDLCQSCGKHSPFTVCWDCGHNIGENWVVTWLPLSRDQGGAFGNSGKVFTGTSEYNRWFYWTDNNGNGDSKTGYRYSTRTYSWGQWSEWSDTYVAASTTRNVDGRYVYRYKLP